MSVDLIKRFKASTGCECFKYRISGDLLGHDGLSIARERLEELKIMRPGELFEDMNGWLVPQGREANMKIAEICPHEGSRERLHLLVRPCGDPNYSAELSTQKGISANTPTSGERRRSTSDSALGSGDFETAPSEDGNTTITSYTSYLDPSSAQNASGLSHEERATLIDNSPLGCGVNLSSDETGCYGPPVIKHVLPQDVYLTPTNTTNSVSVVTHTAREATYAAGGWYESGINAESPWVKGYISSDISPPFNPGSVYITGRYTHSFCQMRLPEELEPHPSLVTAVRKALNLNGDSNRREALKGVFARWGFFFVDGVDMGGIKYMTSVSPAVPNASIAGLEGLMQSALMEKIHSFVSSGINTAGNPNQFSSGMLMSRGGHISAPSVDSWTASLMNWKLWRCTRPTSIRSIMELFDTDLQNQINALGPSDPLIGKSAAFDTLVKMAIPMYHVNYAGHDNVYTSDLCEAQQHINNWGGRDRGIVGRVLPAPEMGSVPLYRTWNGERHFLTADPAELNEWIIHHKAQVERHAGYVFPTQVEGTIPLYHLYHEERRQHAYLSDLAHVEHCCKNLQYKRRGVTCYLFPE